MKLTFLGAAKTVTGSCYYLEANGCSFLVDCGMFQGHSKENLLNEEPFPFDPAQLDFILLTHAHIDHSGRLPKIFLDGFKGPIYATKATAELSAIMLPDSGHIQEIENEWTNRKRQRAGRPPVKPLYTFQDALDCIKLFKNVSYGDVIEPFKGIRARFNDAGHILGSSILELWINENGRETKLVFSGDLGNKDVPILRDPAIIQSADYLIMESTYGDRLHVDKSDKVQLFLDIINETVDKGGNVVIPSFAVGRTQEIIYDLHKQRDKYGDKMKKLFSIPVYVDSPLAVSATNVFRNNLDCFDEEARQYIENGDNPLDFPGLRFTQTSDESKALNEKNESMIIISASGMCEAGRIKHHLKHNLWREDSTILFVGYQAQGTLGRKLVDGAKKVKIFGEEISVNARIEMIEGFSGHADRDGLLDWLSHFSSKPGKVFIVHGEEASMQALSKYIGGRFNIETEIPDKGESVTITSDAIPEVIKKPAAPYEFRRLALMDQLENLKEELDEMIDTVRGDLRQEKDDAEIDSIMKRLKELQSSMAAVNKRSF